MVNNKRFIAMPRWRTQGWFRPSLAGTARQGSLVPIRRRAHSQLLRTVETFLQLNRYWVTPQQKILMTQQFLALHIIKQLRAHDDIHQASASASSPNSPLVDRVSFVGIEDVGCFAFFVFFFGSSPKASSSPSSQASHRAAGT